MPRISIIVPVYNSHINIALFFDSLLLSNFKDFEVIINDDKRTDDITPNVVKDYQDKGLNIIYKIENISMAQGRKQGAVYASGDILIHLDSDMTVTLDLLGEIVSKMDAKEFDALVIPEEAFGTTFWARCKWLEKKMYEGNDHIESLRVVTKKVYDSLDGHDEDMVLSEDKDFDIRVREAGYKVGRVRNYLGHNEGELRLIKTTKKKQGYAKTENFFRKKHPKQFMWQANVFNRYWIFAKHIRYLFIHPILYIGVITMKTAEYAFVTYAILRAWLFHK